jgi:hypothetical protein
MRQSLPIRAVVLLLFVPAVTTALAAQDLRLPFPIDASADDAASFIGGFPCASEALKRLQASADWKRFAERLDTSWADLDAKRLAPMRQWAAAELGLANQETRTVFYPFGGPDLLTPLVLFPDADTYVLLGLEFVGRLPALETASPEAVRPYLGELTAAISDFLNKSYFITRHMDETLTGDKVDGVLPLFGFFLKRQGFMISSVKRLDLLDKGEITESDATQARKGRRPYGLKIEFFKEGVGRLRTLFYFSADLADAAFRKDSSFHVYLDRLPFETTFVKSASYLMHYKEFANIRNLILTKSRFVLEDDSGIPFRYFKAESWTCQLYGEYIKPVNDFKGVEQADLKAAFAEPARVKPLPFHLGYHWGTNKDAVLYFRKR